jgi:hypothetical protein
MLQAVQLWKIVQENNKYDGTLKNSEAHELCIGNTLTFSLDFRMQSGQLTFFSVST